MGAVYNSGVAPRAPAGAQVFMADASTDFALMRAAVLLDTDAVAAARAAADVLATNPRHEQATLLLAAACRRVGDAQAAVRTLEALSIEQAVSPVLLLELGRAYAAAGRDEEAIACFERSAALDAGLADAWRELASQRFRTGDIHGGDSAFLRFSRLAPPPHDLLDGNVALAEGRLDAAVAVADRCLRRSPDDSAALLLRAQVAAQRGEWTAAETDLRRCLENAPGHAAARYELARLLQAQERIAEALPLIERLLSVEPDEPNFLGLKAQAIRLVGRTAEAVGIVERLVRERPEGAPAWRTYGNLLRAAGDQAGAVAAFRRALAARPGYPEAYWSLANLKTVQLSAQDVEDMRSELARTPAGPNAEFLEFAIGKALEDSHDHASAFEHYRRGNERHRAALDYDSAAMTAFVDRAARLYTREFFAMRSGWGSERRDPIFIVGLPRSGSTLLEQMLACHSQIEGTHELSDLPWLVTDLMRGLDGAQESDYPDPIAGLVRADIDELATRYLVRTEVHRPLRLSRFVDKMLGNFIHIGLIHLLFPHAAIIDVRRHPVACGFSCYKQLFARSINYSYDMTEMGLYYRDYVRLLRHVDEVLPGRVLRVHYEHVVADPERELRRLLEFCGLPFEAACLRFHENRRVVMTISSEQVRRPIYTDSLDQWRRFEPWLGPLREAIGRDILEAYPTRSGASP